MDFDLPENKIAEVTLIGTGGGYGESIVIHAGNGNWIVVDSCEDPKTKKCLPLEYLKKIGVDIANSIKLVVCTHWHDDHIKGLSKLYAEAKSATFSFTSVTDRKKFLQFVELDAAKLNNEASNSSTIEFLNCLKILAERGMSPKQSLQDKILFREAIDSGVESSLYSLSPSDFIVSEFHKEISTLITEYGVKNRRVIIQKPNAKSVVLYLKFGGHRAILGADLEIGKSDKEGWLNIVGHSVVIDKENKATLFKIPHHGSENGYQTDIWNTLIANNSIAKLTPWNLNGKLPKNEMLKVFFEHTNNLYITSLVNSEKPKKRSRETERVIERLGIKIKEIKFELGIIRNRIDICKHDAEWQTDIYGTAEKIQFT
jgi:beta-lactamase superfamily II metal-dependent hydrolase